MILKLHVFTNEMSYVLYKGCTPEKLLVNRTLRIVLQLIIPSCVFFKGDIIKLKKNVLIKY